MDYKGLTYAQVEERKREGRVNQTAELQKKSGLQIFSSHLFTLFNYLNFFLAVLVIMTGQFRNMLFMGTVFFNTLIGHFQEYRARRSLEKLRVKTAPKVHVIREGKEETIPGVDVVQGDFLVLRSGDLIPADCAVVEGTLLVNEAMLTGEQDSVEKDSDDMLYAGSSVYSGNAVVKALKVGNDTYAAEVMKGVRKEKRQPSRLRDALNFIIRTVTFLLVPLGILLFAKQYYLSMTPRDDAILGTVASMVGMIPEGLVLLTSIALNIGAVLLARENTLVQEMYSLETLARVDVFAADKTGTITTGKMNVVKLVPYSKEDCENLIANIVHASKDTNPTSEALRAFFPLKEELVYTHIEPFSSKTKKTVYETSDHTYELGAYTFVTHEENADIEETIRYYAEEGLRVLTLTEDKDVLCLVILKDEIRRNAEETIRYILDQGVDLRVLSGDDPKTVGALLRQIRYPYHEEIFDCSGASDELLREMAEKKKVFGRCTPQQKEVLLGELQKKGHTVGMTGDGINDILALKKADFSIAMNSGAESVKNIANVVLVDDDFVHIPSIIKQGRRVINNIRRTATLFLTKTAMSAFLSILTLFFLGDYPFEPIQLTLVAGLCIGFPSFVLSFEPRYDLVPSSFLSEILRRAVSAGFSIALFISVLYLFREFGIVSYFSCSTMATLLTAIVLIFLIFVISRPLTPLRIGLLVIAVLGMTVAYVFCPYFFSFERLTLGEFGILAGCAIPAVLLEQFLEKSSLMKKLTEKIDTMY